VDRPSWRSRSVRRRTASHSRRWTTRCGGWRLTSVNTTAQFDKSGNPIDGQFGQVTGARDPRVQQMSLRISF